MAHTLKKWFWRACSRTSRDLRSSCGILLLIMSCLANPRAAQDELHALLERHAVRVAQPLGDDGPGGVLCLGFCLGLHITSITVSIHARACSALIALP